LISIILNSIKIKKISQNHHHYYCYFVSFLIRKRVHTSLSINLGQFSALYETSIRVLVSYWTKTKLNSPTVATLRAPEQRLERWTWLAAILPATDKDRSFIGNKDFVRSLCDRSFVLSVFLSLFFLRRNHTHTHLSFLVNLFQIAFFLVILPNQFSF